MEKFKAIVCLLMFGGMGVAVVLGYHMPEDPDCIGKCFTDTVASLQDRIGDGPTAIIAFATGIYSYVYWMKRA